jgi:anti-sigma factor RsiW
MSDHGHWSDSVGAYLLGALEPEESERFEAHLAECATCRRDVDELKVAVDALPVSVAPIRPPAALKTRIMAVVEQEAELLAAAGRRAERPEEEAAEAPARRRSKEPRARRLLGGRLMRPGVALACALALLVLGAAGGVLLSGGENERTVVATTEAPGADVRLEIRDDSSMLVAENMPPPPSGRIYQVWLKRPGKDPEPTSVLWSTRRDGSAAVAVPGSLEGVEAVLVTDEPAGGSDRPSRTPVITAVTA